MNRQSRMTIQLICACLMTVAGLVLIFMGLWIAPRGEIHNSVLVAFGEIITFAGALFGVDYSYRYKMYRTGNIRDYPAGISDEDREEERRTERSET